MTSSSSSFSVSEARAAMSATCASGANETLEWRLDQLDRMARMVRDRREDFVAALASDLGRHRAAAVGNEIGNVEQELDAFRLREWSRPEHRASPAALTARTYTLRSPLRPPGVLVVGPFNYPVMLALLPAIGALAAGNPVLLKPSERCPATEKVLAEAIPKYFEPGALRVLTGGVDVARELLGHPWGLVFFTGSTRVGKIVAKAAAETLTPVILELGGVNPAVVDNGGRPFSESQMKNLCDRIVDMKLVNCGQTCVAINTLYVLEQHKDEVRKGLVDALHRQYGPTDDPKGHGFIVGVEDAKRVVDMIKEVEKDEQATILTGGSHLCLAEKRYVHPTIVWNPPSDSTMVQEEIFGPVLPVVVVESRQHAIAAMRRPNGTPLSLSVFTNDSNVFREYLRAVPSGTAVKNDSVVQFGTAYAPIGGTGSSGMGAYRGRASYEAFTHPRLVLERPLGSAWDFFGLRMHPFTPRKLRAFENIISVGLRTTVPVLSSLVRSAAALAVAFVGGIIVGRKCEWIF